MKPLPCVVLLPATSPEIGVGETTDDAYAALIAPAIRAAGFEPVRPTRPLADALNDGFCRKPPKHGIGKR